MTENIAPQEESSDAVLYGYGKQALVSRMKGPYPEDQDHSPEAGAPMQVKKRREILP